MSFLRGIAHELIIFIHNFNIILLILFKFVLLYLNIPNYYIYSFLYKNYLYIYILYLISVMALRRNSRTPKRPRRNVLDRFISQADTGLCDSTWHVSM